MLEHLAQDPDLVLVAFDGAAHALLLAFALGNINLDFLNTQGGLAGGACSRRRCRRLHLHIAEDGNGDDARARPVGREIGEAAGPVRCRRQWICTLQETQRISH